MKIQDQGEKKQQKKREKINENSNLPILIKQHCFL